MPGKDQPVLDDDYDTINIVATHLNITSVRLLERNGELTENLIYL